MRRYSSYRRSPALSDSTWESKLEYTLPQVGTQNIVAAHLMNHNDSTLTQSGSNTWWITIVYYCARPPHSSARPLGTVPEVGESRTFFHLQVSCLWFGTQDLTYVKSISWAEYTVSEFGRNFVSSWELLICPQLNSVPDVTVIAPTSSEDLSSYLVCSLFLFQVESYWYAPN